MWWHIRSDLVTREEIPNLTTVLRLLSSIWRFRLGDVMSSAQTPIKETHSCRSFYDHLWPNLGADGALQAWKTTTKKTTSKLPTVFDTNKNTEGREARSAGKLLFYSHLRLWLPGDWTESLPPVRPHIQEGLLYPAGQNIESIYWWRAWTESLHWES